MVISETLSSFRSLRESVMGPHFAELSRSGLMLSSMNIGIENMKRRKFRSALSVLSISLIIFALVALSSITTSPTFVVQLASSTEPSSYSGLIVRTSPVAPIHEGTFIVFKSALIDEATVVPRGFLYPPALPPSVAMVGGMPYIAFTPSMHTKIYGMLALSHEEPDVSGIDSILDSGNWFSEDDLFAVIIPDIVAESLSDELGRKIDVGSNISLWGLTLRVIGIANSTKLDTFFNPDGESIRPVDPTSQSLELPSRLDASRILIIPYKLHSRISYLTPIANIGIRVYNESRQEYLLKNFSLMLRHRVYVAQEGEPSMSVVSRQWYNVIGGQFLLVPTLIACACLLNLMLGMLYERAREIHIYNAIGMSPMHITMSFLTESFAYAVPSVFLGYLSGMIVTDLLIAVGQYPADLYPNFSSLTILVVIALGLVTVVVSTIWPARLAARLAVPFGTRRWIKRFKKPTEDIWHAPVPIISETKEEVLGLLAFLREYFTYSVERESMFDPVSMHVEEAINGDIQTVRLVAKIRQAPYDMGIESKLVFQATRKKRGMPFEYSLTMERIAGYAKTWRISCPIIVDEIRKQLLIWRSFSGDEQRKYLNLGERMKGG